MRMSCNGCRVLRKGCSEDCTLRPCLQWITSPESQANATLFLAKFYGRAGLVNLIDAGPAHLRPEIFRSLLHEACGRIINPVYGSIGLMCSGNWPRCQAAVEAVLLGAPPMKQLPGGDDDSSSAAAEEYPVLPLQGCDIRHLSKDAALHRVRTRNRFKRSASQVNAQVDYSLVADFVTESEEKFTITGWNHHRGEEYYVEEELKRAPSHDSFSVETVEPSLMNRDQKPVKTEPEPSEIGLELTLGLNPMLHAYPASGLIEISDSEG